MSDDNSPVVEEQKKKRGRPAKADKTVTNATKEPKKRGRPALEKNNVVRPAKSDNEDDAPPTPIKKARGRPKGSHKKKPGSLKPVQPSGRGRGRPRKKEEKPESTGEEEDEPEEGEEEEEEN